MSGRERKHGANLPYRSWCDRLPCRRDLRRGPGSYRALRLARSAVLCARRHSSVDDARLTDFPAGVIKVIPIVLHQWVERIVGPVLIILAFVLMTEATQIARAFF